MNNNPHSPGIAEEIRKALDAATPGPWEVKHDASENRYSVYKAPIGYGNAITGWGKVTQTKEDAHLIANAPTWLRSLLTENERITKEKAAAYLAWAKSEEQLREELEQVKKERDMLQEAYTAEQMNAADAIAERNDEQVKVESLRSQLADKDKVLEEIANAESYTSRDWFRQQARSIIEKYKEADTSETGR